MTNLSLCRASILLAAECASVQAEKDRIRGRLAAYRYWRNEAIALRQTADAMRRCAGPKSHAENFGTGGESKVVRMPSGTRRSRIDTFCGLALIGAGVFDVAARLSLLMAVA